MPPEMDSDQEWGRDALRVENMLYVYRPEGAAEQLLSPGSAPRR